MEMKKNLWGVIARYVFAFLFMTSWIILGVALAIGSDKFDIGGKVTFQATNIYADITGTITGTKTTNSPEKFSLDANATTFTSPDSWKNLVFDFDSPNNIVFTINITNKSTESSFWITFEDSIAIPNTVITRKVAGKEVDSFSNTEVSANSTKTFEITMKVENLNEPVDGDFILAFILTNKEPEITDENSVTFQFTDVYADITGNITGSKTSQTLEDIHINSNNNINETILNSWKNLVLAFNDDAGDIVFTISITNQNTDRSLWVTIEDTFTTNNVTITRVIDGTSAATFSKTEVSANSTKTFEITMKVTDANLCASLNFNLTLNLSQE